MGQGSSYVPILNGVFALAGSADQASAMRLSGDYSRTIARINASNTERQAQDAIARGDEAASEHAKRVKQLLGSQRVSAAAGGIDASYGSPLDVQKETMDLGAKDVLTIKNNAVREAWGYRSTGNNYLAQGELDAIGANARANSTLLTGGVQALAGGFQTAYDISKSDKASYAERSGRGRGAAEAAAYRSRK